MPAQVAIVHGWSDTSKSFADLSNFLKANGYTVSQIWLGDYISMDDDVRIEDAAKRMHDVIGELIANGDLKVPFDLIVHSTGGLVAREWIVSNYPDGKGCPAKRLVMLAPANFGSRLASIGKSMIGRVARGWNNWFQTGAEMLKALELASPFQWDLARRDLLDPNGEGTGPYGVGKVWPFVIVGSVGYPSGMRQIVNEDGSDGTVRVAAANLNVAGLTVDFTRDIAQPEIRPWHWRAGAKKIPLAVLPDRNHTSIVHPDPDTRDGKTGSEAEFAELLGQLILRALRCETQRQYDRVYEDWHALSEETAALAYDDDRRGDIFLKEAPAPEALHQYMQVVTLVRDDHGQPVEDYFLEFYSPETSGNEDIVRFQRDVLEHVHVNGERSSLRCLFIDRSDLIMQYYGRIRDPAKRRVAVSVSAANPGKNVRYFDSTREGARGHLVIHEEAIDRREALGGARLHRNTTHLVEIVIPRQPTDKVFGLSRSG